MSDEYERKNQIRESAPHPDVDKNAQYYHRMMGKIEWIEPVTVEVSDRETQVLQPPYQKDERGREIRTRDLIREYKNATFVFRKYENIWTFNISFHIEHQKFREELCNILNEFGHKGYLRRTDNPPPKPQYNAVGKGYDDLFGR